MAATDQSGKKSLKDWSSSRVVNHFDQFEDLSEFPAPYVFIYGDALRDVGRKQDALRVMQSLKQREIIEHAEAINYRISLFMGQVYQDMGAFPEAVIEFREALSIDSQTTVTHVYLASALHELGEFEESLKVLDKALSIKGDTDEVYLNIALSLRSMKRYQEAYEAVQQALEIDPQYQSAQILRDDLSEVVEKT